MLSLLYKNIKIGTLNDPIIDPNDEYLEIKYVITQTIPKTIPKK